jgi:hypothetical protein
MARANRFDGLILLGTCDKIIPGLLMAAARLDCPAIVVTSGPMMPAEHEDRVIVLSDVKEAMGRYKHGTITAQVFHEIECRACSGPGACGFMGTVNTMADVTETLGLITARLRDPARCRSTPCRSLPCERSARGRPGRTSRDGAPDANPALVGKCGACVSGAGRLDQRRAASACHCTLRWRRIDTPGF